VSERSGWDGTESPLALNLANLVPGHITTLSDILTLEQEHIIRARRWALSPRRKDNVASVAFLLDLHRRMFSGIWKWAGQLRRTDSPDGARWPTIGFELHDLVAELQRWQQLSLYTPDEGALIFHHRLVRIRAFEGGNGSHGRLAADALVVSLGRPPFSWGVQYATSAALVRERYLKSMRDADSGTIQPLRDFARS